MEKIFKILMLEDSEDDADLIKRTLVRNNIQFTYSVTDTREEFIEALNTFCPDVILSDHSLPQFNSIEALKLCQQKGYSGAFILVTGAVSEEFAVNCLMEGADDYILKSNLARLPSAITNALKQRHSENEKNRTMEILRQQNEELLKINMELDKFVYSTSHDLKAPLKSVLGLIHLAKVSTEENSKESIGDYLSMMERSVIKLDSTLKNILQYSRNNRINVETEPIDFEKFLYETWNGLKHFENRDNINFTISVSGDCPFYSDLLRLSVIFNNLISNSIKYQKEKGPFNIHISGEINEKEANLIIEDNGIGINEKYVGNVFNMFYRATEKSEGSGLGLYIVKETIMKMDGKIRLESVEKKGTKVYLTIPNYIQDIQKSSN